MEGKAPSLELQSAFDRFRARLVCIHCAIRVRCRRSARIRADRREGAACWRRRGYRDVRQRGSASMRWRWRRRCPPEHPRSNPPRPKADTPATPAGNSEEQLANDAGTTFPRPSPSAGTIDLRTLLDGVKDDDGTTCVGAPRGSRGSIAIGEDRRSVNAGLADGGRKGERGKGHRPQATSGTLRDLFEAAGVTLPARYPRWRWHRRVERATGLKGRGGRKGKGGWRRPVGLRVGARAHRGRTREQGRGCPATGRDPRDSGEPGGCIRCGRPLARVQMAPPTSR